MFEDYLKKSRERWEKSAKDILLSLEKVYDAFSQELIEDLSRKKLVLERDVARLGQEAVAQNEAISKASGEMLKLNSGLKTTKENLKKYEAKQQEMLSKITEIKEREIKCSEKEQRLNEKEKNLDRKEEEVKIEVHLLEERQKEFKKRWDRANTNLNL